MGTWFTTPRQGDAGARAPSHIWGVVTAAQPFPARTDSSWRVSRDGVPVAVVALCHEGDAVVVAADVAAAQAGARRHRFETLQAAEAFVGDLIASFGYLGCDVATA